MQDIFGAKNSAEFRKEVDVFTQNEKIRDYVITYKNIWGKKRAQWLEERELLYFMVKPII